MIKLYYDHNMIVQDERDSDTVEEFQDEDFTFTVKKSTKPPQHFWSSERSSGSTNPSTIKTRFD